MTTSLFPVLPLPCVCFDPAEASCGCQCPEEEKALRLYIREDSRVPAMTAEQREWCLSEIDSVEGYQREDYESSDDAGLAQGVMNAWLDYCRDKGLL